MKIVKYLSVLLLAIFFVGCEEEWVPPGTNEPTIDEAITLPEHAEQKTKIVSPEWVVAAVNTQANGSPNVRIYAVTKENTTYAIIRNLFYEPAQPLLVYTQEGSEIAIGSELYKEIIATPIDEWKLVWAAEAKPEIFNVDFSQEISTEFTNIPEWLRGEVKNVTRFTATATHYFKYPLVYTFKYENETYYYVSDMSNSNLDLAFQYFKENGEKVPFMSDLYNSLNKVEDKKQLIDWNGKMY